MWKHRGWGRHDLPASRDGKAATAEVAPPGDRYGFATPPPAGDSVHRHETAAPDGGPVIVITQVSASLPVTQPSSAGWVCPCPGGGRPIQYASAPSTARPPANAKTVSASAQLRAWAATLTTSRARRARTTTAQSLVWPL